MLKNKYIQSIFIVVFWLAVWQLLAELTDNSILMASPLETFNALSDILSSGDLIPVLKNSMGRIFAGLLLAVVSGTSLAILSCRAGFLEMLLKPALLSVKSIPVASFVVLLLIWQGSEPLSVWISFLVAFPVIYTNILEGLKNADKKMLEMAEVFGLSLWNKAWYIYRPMLKGYILSSIKLAAGMGIKAGVAAEIIGLPSNSFGESLYMSKIYLDTDSLFAWTIIIVLTSFATEKLSLLLAKLLLRLKPPVFPQIGKRLIREKRKEEEHELKAVQLNKSYGERRLFSDLNLSLDKGEIMGITAPSGGGKTTLFRILLGLEKADGGSVYIRGRAAALFQEPLLCADFNAFENMKIAGADYNKAKELLIDLLPKDELLKNCSAYSLGMQRRCAAVRALACDFDILLLDEPFASLDMENRIKLAAAIRESAEGKAVIIFTHSEEDMELLGAEYKIVKLN